MAGDWIRRLRRKRKRGRPFRVIVLAAVLALGGCYPSILDPAGPVGAGEKLILIDAVVIMLAIVVPTILATLGFAWWFRASNRRAAYMPDWAYSGRVEMVVWSIPILVVLFLGGMAWISSHQLDPAEPLPGGPPLEVEGVSLDWKWLFIYPDQGVASVNQLVIPVGRPVRFSLTSGSVMNAFFIPRLGSMIYTMNGMVSPLNLRADKPGDYYGLSTQFSGDGFSNMHFVAKATSPADFTRWVAVAKAAGPVLDRQSYIALTHQTLATAPFTYRAVTPHLFNDIVLQKLPTGPGPISGRPSPAVIPKTRP